MMHLVVGDGWLTGGLPPLPPEVPPWLDAPMALISALHAQ